MPELPNTVVLVFDTQVCALGGWQVKQSRMLSASWWHSATRAARSDQPYRVYTEETQRQSPVNCQMELAPSQLVRALPVQKGVEVKPLIPKVNHWFQKRCSDVRVEWCACMVDGSVTMSNRNTAFCEDRFLRNFGMLPVLLYWDESCWNRDGTVLRNISALLQISSLKISATFRWLMHCYQLDAAMDD